MPTMESRRHFLTQLATVGFAGLGSLPLVGRRSFTAEPPPEVTTIRLEKAPVTCIVPQYAAEELLHAEGFADVRWVELSATDTPARAVAQRRLDWDLEFTPEVIAALGNGESVTMVAGVHVGCFELFAQEHVRTIAGLKGRTVGLSPGYLVSISAAKNLVSLMAKNVGLDPSRDIRWLSDTTTDLRDLFNDGKIDAFLSLPPEAQELRDRKIGHSILNSTVDRPWSQYFCCMLIGRTEFVQKYPVATKRIVRAILKATDLCASEPERVARLMVERGFTPSYDYALQSLQELGYRVWRDYDPEDTVRFYALRMNEVGLTKVVPQQIISEHTDWRFLNEVKRELKA